MRITPDATAPRSPRRPLRRGGTIEVAPRIGKYPSAVEQRAERPRAIVLSDGTTEKDGADFLEVASDCRLRVLCRICTG